MRAGVRMVSVKEGEGERRVRGGGDLNSYSLLSHV